MIRITKLCLLGLSLVMLCASAGQAAVSGLEVLGDGNIVVSGDGAAGVSFAGSTSVAGTWADLEVEDVVIDADPVTDSSPTMSRSYNVIQWWNAPYVTTFTANLTIEEWLMTDNVGDWASNDVTVKLEVFDNLGGLIASSGEVSYSNSVADGEQSGTALEPVSTPMAVSATKPAGTFGSSNSGSLKLTVDATVSAFTAPVDDGSGEPGDPGDPGDPCDPGQTPVIPAPGAIALASLGMGLVSWLRTRRTL